MTESEETVSLSGTEDRIRFVVESNMAKALEDSWNSFQAALDGAVLRLDNRIELVLKESRAANTAAQEDIKKLRERVDALERRELKTPGLGIPGPLANAMLKLAPKLTKAVPEHKQEDLVEGFGRMLDAVQGKTTVEAQRILYKVGDETVKMLNTSGEPKKFVHLEKPKLALGAGACLAVGIGAGVGGTMFLVKRQQRQAGYSNEDYKSWLQKGAPPAAPKKGPQDRARERVETMRQAVGV